MLKSKLLSAVLLLAIMQAPAFAAYPGPVLPPVNGGTGGTSLDGAGIVTKGTTQTITGAKSYTTNPTSFSGISSLADQSQQFILGRYSVGSPWSYLKPDSTSSGYKFNNASGTLIGQLDNVGDLTLGLVTGQTVFQLNGAAAANNSPVSILGRVGNFWNQSVSAAGEWQLGYNAASNSDANLGSATIVKVVPSGDLIVKKNVNQPLGSFAFPIISGANQPVAALTSGIIVVFDTILADNQTEFNVGTNKFTAAETGLYQVIVNLEMTADAAPGVGSIVLKVNGATNCVMGDSLTSATTRTSVGGTFCLEMNAGAYLQIGAFATTDAHVLGSTESYMQVLKVR
jgi:hypothetical protein